MSRDDKIDNALRIMANMAREFEILSPLFRGMAEKLDGVADSNNEEDIGEVLATYKSLLELETFQGLDPSQKLSV